MPELAIEVRDIAKRYDHHVAVRSLSLNVPKGAVYGLLGPNGAGNTTLLNIIAPDSGSVRILGSPHNDPKLVDRIGYLPEERGLYRKMQVHRVLRFLGELKGLRGADLDRRIDSWLDRLQLRTNGQDWGKAKVDELSRGMQQKVQFAGALLHKPELVILDEPFSGLDPVSSRFLPDIVREEQRRGRTMAPCCTIPSWSFSTSRSAASTRLTRKRSRIQSLTSSDRTVPSFSVRTSWTTPSACVIRYASLHRVKKCSMVASPKCAKLTADAWSHSVWKERQRPRYNWC